MRKKENILMSSTESPVLAVIDLMMAALKTTDEDAKKYFADKIKSVEYSSQFKGE